MGWEQDRLVKALLFGLRAAAAGMLALYLAFWLELDEPGWAGTSAVIVAQPVLGAALRKGTFRLIGTVAGAVFAVVLTACFPQDRIGFFAGLAVWGGVCAFLSTFLRGFASYGAMLAGYTAAIVATAAVPSPPDAFLLAVARGSSICIGIVSTTVVFGLTDHGTARAALARALDELGTAALNGLRGVLGGELEPLDVQQQRRRGLIGRVAALDTRIDESLGENVDLRSRVGGLRRAVVALLRALACWRGMEQHIRRLPEELAALPGRIGARLETAEPIALDRDKLRALAVSIGREPTRDLSEQLLIHRLAEALDSLADVAAALVLLRDPTHAQRLRSAPSGEVNDILVAVVIGARVALLVTVCAAFWIATGWSEGGTFLTFAMVVGLLFGTRGEAAYKGGVVMAESCVVALTLAGALRFAVLPALTDAGPDGFWVLALALGGAVATLGTVAVLLPETGLLSALAFASLANLMPMFSAQNVITYDYAGFLNSALAILAGSTAGAASYLLVPQLSPPQRIARQVAGARRDLERLVTGAWSPSDVAWDRRLHVRLLQMQQATSLLAAAQVLAALSVGHDILRIRMLRQEGGSDAAFRVRALHQEIRDAVASHPGFFAGIPLDLP